jgi:hypothetical protein
MLTTSTVIPARRKASFKQQSHEAIEQLIARLGVCRAEELPALQRALAEEHRALVWLESLAVKGAA